MCKNVLVMHFKLGAYLGRVFVRRKELRTHGFKTPCQNTPIQRHNQRYRTHNTRWHGTSNAVSARVPFLCRLDTRSATTPPFPSASSPPNAKPSPGHQENTAGVPAQGLYTSVRPLVGNVRANLWRLVCVGRADGDARPQPFQGGSVLRQAGRLQRVVRFEVDRVNGQKAFGVIHGIYSLFHFAVPRLQILILSVSRAGEIRSCHTILQMRRVQSVERE